MSWAQVALAGVPHQPWKNGLGTTRELLAWPVPDDWQVRLSVAEVRADGPFSRFEGVKRCFAVLSGEGVRLLVDGVPHLLTADSDALAFDGGVDTSCELLGGATRDFNLMARAGVPVLRRVRGDWQSAPTAGLQAVYAVASAATVRSGPDWMELPPHTLAWRLGGGAVSVRSDDALWMELNT